VSELRVAVVGAGRIGLTHAESLVRRVHGARLVAATTSRPERSEALCRACGTVSVHPSLEALLEAEALDAAVIASSTSAHVDNVVRCAAAGVHLLCEKPLALDLDGCDRAMDAAATAGVKLMIGHVRRFDSGYVEAKRLIESGAIGRPVLYRSISGDMDPPPPSFADLSVSGGLILDSMYHDIYLGRWLLADEVVRVHGEGEALIDDGVRSVGDVDNAVVSLRFAGGAMGSLSASRVTRYAHDLRGEVIGDEGAVQIGALRRRPLRLLDRNGVHHDTVHTSGQRMGDAFAAMLQSFVDCVHDNIEPPVTAADSRATVAAAIAATESIRTGLPVTLGGEPARLSPNDEQSTTFKE
jgi:scyllo-inositol 2-dehydrogenase (NAD+)